MVIEFLTFLVPVEQEEAWLAREQEVWGTFLASCDGFVRREIWRSDPDLSRRAGDPAERASELGDYIDSGVRPVHVAIWWETLEQWKAVTPETVASIDAEMGDLVVPPTMQTFSMVVQG